MVEQEIINECWRSVSEYENYQVSNIGRVRNVSTSRILKPDIRDGYYQVKLYQNKITKTHKIHKLVANEFLIKPDTDDKLIIDHINRNRTDNQITNLRWASYAQNNWNVGNRTNTMSKYKGVSFHNKSWRARISNNGNDLNIGYFSTEKEAAKAYNNKVKELRDEYSCVNEISDSESDNESDDKSDA